MKNVLATASLVFALAWSVSAQGMIPNSKPAAPKGPHEPYVLIGEPVPNDLMVTDKNGNVRPILSYKSTVEILVLGFYSSRCPANQTAGWDLQRFFDKYKGWNAVFMGISSANIETLSELQVAMTKWGLKYPVVRDENHKMADRLHILQMPEIVIIDEWGVLRYRGPLQSDDGKTAYAANAIDAMIGHIDSVPSAEPPLGQGCPIQ